MNVRTILLKRKSQLLGVVMFALDPVPQEAEAEGWVPVQANLIYTPSSRPVKAIYREISS